MQVKSDKQVDEKKKGLKLYIKLSLESKQMLICDLKKLNLSFCF